MNETEMDRMIALETAQEKFIDAKVAIAKGSIIDLRKILAGKTFDINMQTSASNGTLLHSATTLGRQDMVELLLENGADPNVKYGEKGPTALIMCAIENQLEMAAVLLMNRADINAKDEAGMTFESYIRADIKYYCEFY